jgi:hypothetical protein
MLGVFGGFAIDVVNVNTLNLFTSRHYDSEHDAGIATWVTTQRPILANIAETQACEAEATIQTTQAGGRIAI